MKPIFKKIVLSLLLIFLFSACKNEEIPTNMFTISGEIKGLNTNLYFRHPDREYSREYPSDSIVVTNGKFTYSDSISELTYIRAYPKFTKDSKLFKTAKGGGYFPVKSVYLMFFASPGANINFSGEVSDFMNAYPSGDDYNNSLAVINKIAYPNYNEIGNLMVKGSYEEDSLKASQIEKKVEDLGKKGIDERLRHLEENPMSLGALWYLDDMLMRSQIEDDKAISIFNNVSDKFKELNLYKSVESRVNGIKSTKEGMSVPSIKTTSTLDGKEFDISTLKGKYVLIDFWGIWCGPCVKEMPEVKEFQEKYKDKLVVLGINSGDKKEKIQKFLTENNYEWQQLMSVKDTSEDNFVTRFNVQGFPTKFIVDPEGKIVKRYVGSGEEAFVLLEELMNN